MIFENCVYLKTGLDFKPAGTGDKFYTFYNFIHSLKQLTNKLHNKFESVFFYFLVLVVSTLISTRK